MSDWNLRTALGAVLLIGTLIACSEQVTGSLGCPDLCANESGTLRDTILTGAVVLDTTFVGFPRLGEDRDITLRNQGDTADVRLVARFDSLPVRYQRTGATSDSLIRLLDSASLIFVIDTLVPKPRVPITIDAYDVDTTAVDTLMSALVPLFRASRLIGSQSYTSADLKDTLRLTLSNAALLAKIKDTLRLRIGLRVRGANNATLRVLGSSFIPRVRFRVSADTTVKPEIVFPRSKTPTDEPTIQSALQFYPVIVSGALPPPPPGRLTVGGLAGARAYLRFDIPPVVLDSVQVIRASLLLTQVRARSTTAIGDTIAVWTQPVLASPTITDLYTAATFLGVPFAYGIDSVRFVPRDSGLRSIEVVNLLRSWRSVGTTNTSRAIVLRSPQEGKSAGEINFVSMKGPVAQRPRLRLTFVPRRGFGIP